jgi:hypothetical protein
MTIQTALAIFSLIVSIGAFAISISAKRQAKKASLIPIRREAINDIRRALGEAKIHGTITAEPVSSAFQHSSLVFDKSIVRRIEDAHGLAFRLQHKPPERWTDKDFSDKEKLITDLDAALQLMVKATALG